MERVIVEEHHDCPIGEKLDVLCHTQQCGEEGLGLQVSVCIFLEQEALRAINSKDGLDDIAEDRGCSR